MLFKGLQARVRCRPPAAARSRPPPLRRRPPRRCTSQGAMRARARTSQGAMPARTRAASPGTAPLNALALVHVHGRRKAAISAAQAGPLPIEVFHQVAHFAAGAAGVLVLPSVLLTATVLPRTGRSSPRARRSRSRVLHEGAWRQSASICVGLELRKIFPPVKRAGGDVPLPLVR